MDQKQAIAALGALAQETRLELFRLLGDLRPGRAAGRRHRRAAGRAPSSLSFHLQQLVHAGLITQRRLSRQLIYSAEYGAMNELLAYLTENCCGRGACVPVCNPADAFAKGETDEAPARARVRLTTWLSRSGSTRPCSRPSRPSSRTITRNGCSKIRGSISRSASAPAVAPASRISASRPRIESELAEVYDRLSRAERPIVEAKGATCCYAKSDKQWIADPQGVPWETFFTYGEADGLRRRLAEPAEDRNRARPAANPRQSRPSRLPPAAVRVECDRGYRASPRRG